MSIRVCTDSAGPGPTGEEGPGGTVHYFVAGQPGVDRTLCGQVVGYDYGTDYEDVFRVARKAGTKVYECAPCLARRPEAG